MSLPPQYTATIKKYHVAFASLFDDICYYTEDTPPKLIKVPITISSKEKFLEYLKKQTETGPEIKFSYPAMAFEMMSMRYASDRATNPQIKHKTEDEVSLNRVPYDFDFNLYITTKKYDDSLKIVEQIIPSFTPDFSITINDNLLGIQTSTPVILKEPTWVIDYEPDFNSSREIVWTLTFTIKGFLYPPLVSIAPPVPVTGQICSTISTVPGNVTLTGTGTTTPICSGGKNVDFTYTLSGFITNTTSTLTGVLTGTRTDDTTYTINLTCSITKRNGFLFGEARGFDTDPTKPIKSIYFSFNYDLTGLPFSNFCVPIVGDASCSAGRALRLIKKTIVDIHSSMQMDSMFDRLISVVDPFEAMETDPHVIIDSIENLP